MRKLLFTLITILPIWSLYAQQPVMCVPPYNFPVSVSGIGTVTNIGGAISNPIYGVSNGAYDNAGNLLFCVKDDGLWGKGIYDGSGNFLSDLTSTSEMILGNLETSEHSPFFNKEIAIVPVPKVCNKYYVIHYISAQGSANKGYLVYEMVDCNTSPPTVYMSNAAVGSNQYVVADYDVWQPYAGIAVRKKNKNDKYYLYVTTDGLYKYEITPNGISNESKLVSVGGALTSIDFFSTTELEVSPDGRFIAWGIHDVIGNETNKVIKFQLTTPTFPADQGALANNTPTIISVTPADIQTTICGLEFTMDNHLYISASIPSSNQGLFFNSNGTTTTTYLSGTTNYYSFLERRLDNKIYMVDYTTGQYAKLDPSSNVITTIPVSTLYGLSNYIAVVGPHNYFTLPDQIDGENYAAFNSLNDLIIKDEPLDMGAEPTLTGLNIWEGEIWNCNSGNTCMSNENPYTYASDFMRVRVTNIGCVNSLPADLHMYWTRGRSGEIWNEHWLDPSIVPSNIINGHPGGREITVVSGTSTSLPIPIPSIAPGASVILTQPWTVPNGNWYPLIGSDNGVNPMICFLGRIVSADDPMNNETLNTAIGTNVRNNNNIATRNSFIITLSLHSPIKLDGSFMVNNSSIEELPIEGIRITGLDITDNIDALENVNIQLEPRLYDRWVANGRRGVGIEDVGRNIIKITDYRLAEIGNLQIMPGEEFTIAPLVELNTRSSLRENTKLYSFLINHYYRDATTRSAGVYHVVYNNEEALNPDERTDETTADITPSNRKLLAEKNTMILTSDNLIHFELDKSWEENVQVSLYDLNGNLLYSHNYLTDLSREISIDAKDYAKGMYVLNVHNHNLNKSYKVILK